MLEISARLPIVRREPNRLGEMRHSRLNVSLPSSNRPQVMMGVRKFRPEPHREGQGRGGLIQLALVLERTAEVVMHLGIIGVDDQGFVVAGHSHIQFALVL